MPIVKVEDGDSYVLRCINGHGSMFASGSFGALDTIEPPSVRFRLSTFPLKVCICEVCGYVELYSDGLNNPERWKTPPSAPRVDPLPETPKRKWWQW